MRFQRRLQPFSLALAAVLVVGLIFHGLAGRSHATESHLEGSGQNVAQQVAVGQAWRGASFPVEDFQDYTSPFGYRSSPYGGGVRFHYGLDLAAPMGSYIRNWWAGQVVEVSDDSACGTSIILESGSWTHIYCHLQGRMEILGGQRTLVDRAGGILISEGQTMPTGVRIGRVGMTGRTTGPHLHWGLKYNSQWVDPGMVLRAMYEQQAATP